MLFSQATDTSPRYWNVLVVVTVSLRLCVVVLHNTHVASYSWFCLQMCYSSSCCCCYCSYLCQEGCVCLSFYLSVCLLTTSCKNYWRNLHENFTGDISFDEEELIKFWKSFTSGSGSVNFLSILSTVWGHFFTFWLISLKKLIRSFKES